MVNADLTDPATRAAVLDREKDVLRIRDEAKIAVSKERHGPVPDLLSLSLAELAHYQFPERQPILYRGASVVFREGHLGQIYAIRGVGKTWLLHTLALVAAFGVNALGFRNPTPCRVLIVDGEMASKEIQGRLATLCRLLHVPDAPLLDRGALNIVAADWQDDYLPRLDTLEGQEAIERFVENANLICLDNRSCLFDPEGEKDPSAWQRAQDYLLSLRRRGKGVMLAHHSNRMGGARGISKAEDPMDLLLKLSRPDDYSQDQGARFEVTFDKARDMYGAAAAPFIAALTPDGWVVEQIERVDGVSDKILKFLKTADDLGERPANASAVIRGAGVNKAAGLVALAALTKSAAVVKHADGYRVGEDTGGEDTGGEDTGGEDTGGM